jgi:hypothetical protein
MFKAAPLSNSCASSAGFTFAQRFNFYAASSSLLGCRLTGLRLRALALQSSACSVSFVFHWCVRSSSVSPNMRLKADGFAAA